MCLNVCLFVVDLYWHIKILLTCISPKCSLYLWPHMSIHFNFPCNYSLLFIDSCQPSMYDLITYQLNEPTLHTHVNFCMQCFFPHSTLSFCFFFHYFFYCSHFTLLHLCWSRGHLGLSDHNNNNNNIYLRKWPDA